MGATRDDHLVCESVETMSLDRAKTRNLSAHPSFKTRLRHETEQENRDIPPAERSNPLRAPVDTERFATTQGDTGARYLHPAYELPTQLVL